MKKMMISLVGMLLLFTSASAQVKTFQKVEEDEAMVVNASDCLDRSGKNYLMWVRYDYTSKAACKKDAKRDGVVGKAVRAEVLYEVDEPLLTYRIISKKYYDKDEKVLKEIHYFHAPWNQVGDTDYSLKLCIYMTGAFHLVAG